MAIIAWWKREVHIVPLFRIVHCSHRFLLSLNPLRLENHFIGIVDRMETSRGKGKKNNNILMHRINLCWKKDLCVYHEISFLMLLHTMNFGVNGRAIRWCFFHLKQKKEEGKQKKKREIYWKYLENETISSSHSSSHSYWYRLLANIHHTHSMCILTYP